MLKPLIVALALAASLTATAAQADPLQARVLAAARATPTDRFAFRRTMVIERTGAARKVVVEQFDPRRPAAGQWTLVTVDGRAPTAKEIAESRKAKRGPAPAYANIAKWFGGPATRSDPAPGRVLYRFARMPAGSLKVGSHDASGDARAEALVDTSGAVPFVERVRVTTTKGFRMMLVASIKTMTSTGRYRPLPDGTVVPGDMVTEMTGSLMGKAGQLKTTITHSEFRAVR